MNYTNHLRVLKINELLNKRIGNIPYLLTIIFFGIFLMILYYFLFILIKSINIVAAKQLFSFILFVYIIIEIANVLRLSNSNNLLSRNVLLVFPLSKYKYLALILLYFFRHVRAILTILPMIILCFVKFREPYNMVLLIVFFASQYIFMTFVLALIFYFLSSLKQRYTLKYLSLLLFPVIFVLQTSDLSKTLTNNFIINMIFELFHLIL